jgi:predicted RNA binding protein YcfA (HicA-like mRNA interferase family)
MQNEAKGISQAFEIQRFYFCQADGFTCHIQEYRRQKELVKLLKSNGFIFVRQTGSHAIYKNTEGKMGVVPIHNRDIPKGTLHGILKDSGLKDQ